MTSAQLAELVGPVFPCMPRGKKPLITGWQANASRDPAIICEWESQYMGCNWGMPTGQHSGIWVLDVDGAEGRDSLNKLEAEHGPLPSTLRCETGRADGGTHYYFRNPETGDIPTGSNRIGHKLDTRGKGGFVIVPPSVHQTEAPYRYISNDVADTPPWLMGLLAEQERREHALFPSNVAVLMQGKRNDGLFRRGCALRRKGHSREEIAVQLRIVNQKNCRPPLDPGEVDMIADSAARYEPGGPDPLQAAWRATLKDARCYGYEQFLALARHLQRNRQDLAIALPLVRIGELMHCDWTQVRRWRNRAKDEGRLQLRERSIRGKRACTYTFIDVPLASAPTAQRRVPLAVRNVPLAQEQSVPLSLKSLSGLVGHQRANGTPVLSLGQSSTPLPSRDSNATSRIEQPSSYGLKGDV